MRTCVGVKFTVIPEDATLSLVPLDGGTTIEMRADSSIAVLLPVGRYEVRARAARCYDYNQDTLTVTRGGDDRSRRIKMTCQ